MPKQLNLEFGEVAVDWPFGAPSGFVAFVVHFRETSKPNKETPKPAVTTQATEITRYRSSQIGRVWL